MPIVQRRRRRMLFLALLMTTVAACRGGGDDDDDDDGGGSTDADAVGLWTGTVNRVGAQNAFAVIASPTDEFVGVVISTTGTGRLLIGTGDVTGTTLTASGTIFPAAGSTMPNGQSVANVTIPTGTVTQRVSITGAYSGGGETGVFTLNYDPKTSRGASLPAVAGTYTSTGPTPSQSASLTITSLGSLTYATGAGCNATGTFAVPDAGYNVYTFTLNAGVCGTVPAATFNGLATLDDNPAGGTNNLLRMFGATTPTRTLPFGFVGNK